MKERIITGAVLTILFLPLAFPVVSGSPFMCILFAVFAAIGTLEILRCLQLLRSYAVSVPLIVLCGLTPLFAYCLPITVFTWRIGSGDDPLFLCYDNHDLVERETSSISGRKRCDIDRLYCLRFLQCDIAASGSTRRFPHLSGVFRCVDYGYFCVFYRDAVWQT